MNIFALYSDLVHVFSFQEDYCWKNLNVQLVAGEELTVWFCKKQERDEDNMLCILDLTLPPTFNDPGVSVVINCNNL